MRLFNLLNAIRCGKLLYSEMNTYSLYINLSKNNVKMSSTWGQSAWASLKSSSETKRCAFSNGQMLSNNKNFNEWLAGVTDGDGTFYFVQNKNKPGVWSFSFQIAQSSYNMRLLYFIKSKLSIGSISITDNGNMARFRIRNRQQLIKHIIPIFDSHPLLTSKHYRYSLFKKAILIMNDSNKTIPQKNREILQLKAELSEGPPSDYISPAWETIGNSINNIKDAKQVMHKSWVIGFTEAEGSFYIVKKDKKRLVHAFEITQKLDRIVLESIALIFDLKVTKKLTYYTIVTTNSKAIQRISDYFFKTMKGMKSYEYRIWSRSFNKKRKDYEYLKDIRDKMRNVRSIRVDKNFKRIIH